MDRKEYFKQYRENNKERLAELQNEYRNTPMGRAVQLISSYNTSDRKAGRGKGNLTPKWVVNNILDEACVYCGLRDWTKIGCNRIDNSKPHTMDNVEPCCAKCNELQHGKQLSKQVYQYTLDGELVAIYESTIEVERQTGFHCGHISECCNGKLKHYKGFIWSYVPLNIKKEG